MLMYIWLCVITQAFMPGGDRVASLSAGAFEAHLRAEIEIAGSYRRRRPRRPLHAAGGKSALTSRTAGILPASGVSVRTGLGICNTACRLEAGGPLLCSDSELAF